MNKSLIFVVVLICLLELAGAGSKVYFYI